MMNARVYGWDVRLGIEAEATDLRILENAIVSVSQCSFTTESSPN